MFSAGESEMESWSPPLFGHWQDPLSSALLCDEAQMRQFQHDIHIILLSQRVSSRVAFEVPDRHDIGDWWRFWRRWGCHWGRRTLSSLGSPTACQHVEHHRGVGEAQRQNQAFSGQHGYWELSVPCGCGPYGRWGGRENEAFSENFSYVCLISSVNLLMKYLCHSLR